MPIWAISFTEIRAGFASAWTPDASLAGPDGSLPPELVWAVLDCPTSFGAALDGAAAGPAVLARLTAAPTGAVVAEEPHVVIGMLKQPFLLGERDSWAQDFDAALERIDRSASADIDAHQIVHEKLKALETETRYKEEDRQFLIGRWRELKAATEDAIKQLEGARKEFAEGRYSTSFLEEARSALGAFLLLGSLGALVLGGALRRSGPGTAPAQRSGPILLW